MPVNGSSCQTEPAVVPRIRRQEFLIGVQKTIAVAFKPDGATYGFVAFLVIVSSTVWATVFHFRLRIPNYFWQLDHNAIAHGISSVVFIFIYTMLFWFAWRSLIARKRMIFKVLAWHIYTAWFVFVTVAPLVPLAFGEETFWVTPALPFATLVFLSVLTYINCWLIHKKSRTSLDHAIRRRIRKNIVKQLRQFDHERRAKHAIGLYVALPVYMVLFLVAMHAAIDALSFGFVKQTWTVFDGVPGQVAVYRNGEYWIVKDVRRISDTLLMYPKTRLVKVDDPKYSVVRFTTERYFLKEIDAKKLAELGVFGTFAINIGSTDKID